MSERNYKEEAKYHATPLQKKRRAKRNAARRKLMREGRVHKNDGRDVNHVNPGKGGNLSNAPSNLRVEPRSVNRARK